MLPFNSSSRNMGADPKTPEPSAVDEELHQPSPPRPRLRLKRRHVPQHLNAPTQHFLASVAAADVPVPSIEVQVDDSDSMEIYEHLSLRTFSPPKTPAVEVVPSSETKYPNWSVGSEWSCSDIESSPEYESSRPSTAFSTQTSASLFSQLSHASEDDDFANPEFNPPECSGLKPHSNIKVTHEERSRKAPWTKAMDSHLWSTYMLYLQDPRVTPIRLGRSRIPPSGVCLRVAREAKRSWKGSRAHLTADMKSGSNTPTAESPKPYMEWPHTCAATRAHLRELCRIMATASPGKYKSPSPTPFHKAAHRRWNRKYLSATSPSVFSAHDMAFSLAVSTSDTMRPEAPLAQLTSSEAEPLLDPAVNIRPEMVTPERELPSADIPHLPSPVLAKSYGPSSSSSLADGINLPRQSNTLDSRKLLKSPVRLTRSRSGTQKRRSVKSLEELPRKRPSISTAFWKASEDSDNPTRSRDSKRRDQSEVLSGQKTHCRSFSAFSAPRNEDPFVISTPSENSDMQPRRLGSPFSGAGSSHSFPNRLSTPINFNLTALRRPFATVQQPNQGRSGTQSPPRSSLASRLAYLDQRLREIRNRSGDRRRSQSPL
ncbi:uncharacterized protein GGS22DRAFT_175162 [Annulohypoxylon maeteangense]|uniref:uncharacterized protein n=1 Tax=Annulohypoxylon maeteangense TaxID=1927788 RepID=UPI0020075E17|nr:uncharacterized protein GGS22DRAFT_175162 [Annulohypoxylon maeteangense]KAI0880388.1 hypothetical protein GGS22DRAFT_175162 [Annulohypoxylon maeteangense]